MPEIQNPDIGRKLQRRLGLTGQSPTPFLSPEIVAVILADDLRGLDIQEVGFLRNCDAWTTTGATALNAGRHSIVNPLGSGVLATVEDVVISTDINMLLEIGMFTAEAANSFLTRRFRDSRISGTPACGFLQETLTPATTTNRYSINSGVQGTKDQVQPFTLGWVLSPGFELKIEAGVNNQPMIISWRWSERLIERG